MGDMHLNNNKVIIKDAGTIESYASVWWHCHYIKSGSMRVAGGPVETAPSASTLGGWQLDNASEYLYWDANICQDWDGASDPNLCVMFETNTDNSGGSGTDTVDFDLTVWYKAFNSSTMRTQAISHPTIVGAVGQYTLFLATIPIDWDYESNVMLANDVISGRLNLNTGASEVNNIILNHLCFRYKTRKVKLEV